MTELDIVDADIVPQRASDDTVIRVHLRELPREVHQCCTLCRPPDSHCHSHEATPLPLGDEPMLPIPSTGPSELDKALAFHRLQEEEYARGGKFDWLDWLQSLLAAQGRRDVATYKDLIAMGERRGFFG